TEIASRYSDATFVVEDLEGIAYDFISNSLWIVEEENRNLINISMEGNLITRYDQIISGQDNSGLEGICITPSGNFFIIKEKNPSLFIELNSNFSSEESIEMNIADDLSGMCYDRERQSFWLVSDKSKKLFLWNKTEGIKFESNLTYDKFEGIYYIEQENNIYIVNDEKNKLYYYKLINNRSA
ncbi:MAG: SdiA-regulated domain-containing protein, partial [Candidatus Cloacimonetes bacterium]|nr:SdiA-regulated domain-containing protein [Candidatus Cloacimonadota bacterium]